MVQEIETHHYQVYSKELITAIIVVSEMLSTWIILLKADFNFLSQQLENHVGKITAIFHWDPS